MKDQVLSEKGVMTVAQLRKALRGVPGDAKIVQHGLYGAECDGIGKIVMRRKEVPIMGGVQKYIEVDFASDIITG